MATDQFDGVGVLSQEISQATYAELIYTRRRSGKAIQSPTPDVALSLARVAFGRKDTRTRPETVPLAIPSAGSAYRYSLTQPSPCVQTPLTNDMWEWINNPTVSTFTAPDCPGSIASVRTYFEWNGVPRQPLNIFSVFCKYTYRDPDDHTKKITLYAVSTHDGRWGTITPVDCNTPTTCDFWKQQGDSGIVQDSITNQGNLTQQTMPLIEAGDVVSLKSHHNWLWSIPASTVGTSPDALVTLWEDPPEGLIESAEYLFLANTITPIGTPTPVCSGPFECDDPATAFDFVIRYTNSRGKQREFRQTFQVTDVYQVATSYPSPPWDTVSAIGNGIKGGNGRWQSAKFILDEVDGSGLDQCSIPLYFRTSGAGTLTIPQFGLSGSAIATDGCNSQVIIEEINRGQAINEVQSIVLPVATGGVWLIGFKDFVNGLIPFNVTASQLRLFLAGLPSISTVNNVEVTGSGTSDDPFLVTFVNELGGTNVPMLLVDAGNLIGTGSAVVTRITAGTGNERQTITKKIGATNNFRVKFSGAQSAQIQFNASLNEMQTALEGISTIGAGNVVVTGDIGDPDADYQGPWHVTFQGVFAGDNVPAMTTTSTNYTVSTDWQGGVGTNEVQLITVTANDGTYVLEIPNPNPTGGEVITAPIAWNAPASDVEEAILNAAVWLDDVRVIKLPHDPDDPSRVQWTVEFRGEWAGVAMPLMVAIPDALRYTQSSVKEVLRGGGFSERQRIQIVNASSGFYRLTFTINGVTYVTRNMKHNVTSATVEQVLRATGAFLAADDVDVTACTTNTPGLVKCHMVKMHPRFGDVALFDVLNRLGCNQLAFSDVPPPPYTLELQECDDLIEGCSPGPLLCDPGDGDPFPSDDPCCDETSISDSANLYTELVLQRELFDPYQTKASGSLLTIRDMALLKGLSPAEYNPYLRNFATGALTATDFTVEVEPKMSVVLVGADEDTIATRRRIAAQIRHGILPSRMAWEKL
jgi:hypothetical protein